MDDCVFCKIVKEEIPSQRVLENDELIVIKDANPQVEGHSLVIPKAHYETFLDMPVSSYESFLKITNEAVSQLLFDTNSTGYNLVMNNKKVAGQLVPHAHLHILPRKEGDGFKVKV